MGEESAAAVATRTTRARADCLCCARTLTHSPRARYRAGHACTFFERNSPRAFVGGRGMPGWQGMDGWFVGGVCGGEACMHACMYARVCVCVSVVPHSKIPPLSLAGTPFLYHPILHVLHHMDSACPRDPDHHLGTLRRHTPPIPHVNPTTPTSEAHGGGIDAEMHALLCITPLDGECTTVSVAIGGDGSQG